MMDNLNYSLLWHSLGISERNQESYRNYFATSTGTTDFPDLMELVKAGWMVREDAPEWSGSEFTFVVTGAGKLKAQETVPKPPKLSRSKMRYKRYLEYGDGYESFLDYCYWDSEPERSWNQA